MAENPNYYAIIPASVRYAKIPSSAKLLYGEITALANKSGFCWASNGYFAKLYGVSINSVSSWVVILEKKGFIKSYVSQKEGNKRKIYIQTYTPKLVEGLQENLETSPRKLVHNSTYNNKDNLGESKDSPIVEVSLGELDVEKKKKESRVKDKEAIYLLFGNEKQPWWFHKQEKEAAIRLFDMKDFKQVKKAIQLAHKHREDPYCPEVNTPFQLEKKWDSLLSYKNRA